MQHVFVSYSHANREFVDRLITDLTYSGVPATYDRWLLKVGDSIIDRIATSLAEASSVVAVLSKASVKSHWVAKELSLGMTSEIRSKQVRVLPVVIDKCKVPPMLADKRYADFRERYYHGFSDLIGTLDPEKARRFSPRFHRWQKIDDHANDLRSILDGRQFLPLREWIAANPTVLVFLLGRLWAFSDAVPGFAFGHNREAIDYLIANGQSFRFEFQAVKLGPMNCSGTACDDVINMALRMRDFVSECLSQSDEFHRAACIRFSEHQMAPPSMDGIPREMLSRRRYINATILFGRRAEYGDVENAIRKRVEELTDGLVEVASYDRLVDAITKSKDLSR